MKNFSLNRYERVKKKNDFEKVYNSGKVFFSSDLIVKLHYFSQEELNYTGVKIATAVSKKSGKAVWRNRVKRLLREAYRLNKGQLVEKAREKNMELFLVFSANKLSENKNKKIFLRDITPGVVELINKIADNI